MPVLALAILLCIHSVRAAERWSDPTLPVHDGLVLWLDASRQNAARLDRRAASLAEGAEVDVWFDSSGRGFHVSQGLSDARPRFHGQGGEAAVAFDGKDDFLAASNLGIALTNATVFIHAAPISNPGAFRAFLAINEFGHNDYTSGMTIDLGPFGTADLAFLNLEGAGFEGAVNLFKGHAPFSVFHTFASVIESGPNGNSVRLYMDSDATGQRVRRTGTLRTDELTVGARRFSNTPSVPPFVQGFFQGEIAEVLLYNRTLAAQELEQVQNYLQTKYASLKVGAIDPARQPLVPVKNPPPIQMLVPGFAVRELPLDLNNINSVKYRADGKLVALAYDGTIYLLTDTDGDGLEDKAEVFWERGSIPVGISMALTPPGYPRGNGVFVPTKGKLSLIVDTNGDDKADQEIIVATGWPPPTSMAGGASDSMGVALDPENDVYFGIGTDNFLEAYLIDPVTGKSRYSLESQRGTIQKVSADFRTRQTVCTGIRFPVGMAFNATGDLFCTDQEGATWLPNGNPLDELLHIQPGRHYGFPPRHPKHLPNVIDEPSVFDYAPQHESTCGLNFNEPVNGGPVFGPEWWRGDALIAGESRGKLYRTKLVKTPAGYVAQNQILGCLGMLTIDVCVSPAGDLVATCHSGAPDWGSGPTGKGKLYKIFYSDKAAPQPVSAYAAGPGEFRIAFDRPLNPAQLKNLARQTTITRGKYVTAGDAFESFRPGYQVITDQLAAPRYQVPVLSASVSQNARELFLKTPPQFQAVNYSITLPGLSPLKEYGAKELRQEPRVDLATDLTGIEASWTAGSGTNHWSGWLPHLDLDVARAFSTHCAEAESLWPLLRTEGTLKLRAQLDLWQMLRPAVQPGAKLDYTLPSETVTVVFNASAQFSARIGATNLNSSRSTAGNYELAITHVPREQEYLPLGLLLPTRTDRDTTIQVSWHTAEDSRPRALPLRRLLLPWASPASDVPPGNGQRQIGALAGGSWLRGQKVFFGDAVACYKCHQVSGRGGKVGPDLSNLIYRDYESVHKDIVSPNAALNPDHLAYNIELKDGEGLTGVIQSETPQAILIADATGKSTTLLRAKIASMKPSTVSLMPEGLERALDEAGMKDLMTFLLTRPLEPAPLECAGEPPPRKRQTLGGVVGKATMSQALQPLQIVLCAGPKDHGPGEHDYPLWQKRWSKLLALAEQVTVSEANVWPTTKQFQSARVVVFYSDNPGWDQGRAKELDAFLARGGGLVFLHYAVDGHEHAEELARRIGLAWRGGYSKFRHGPLNLSFQPHPISTGLSKLDLTDESYWNLIGEQKDIELVASAVEENEAKPLIWTRQQGQGRVFVSIPGHYTWTFDDPQFRLLLLRGICWCAHEPIDRLSDLAEIGARVAE